MGRPRGKRKAEDNKELKTDALFRPIKLRPCQICADSASDITSDVTSDYFVSQNGSMLVADKG